MSKTAIELIADERKRQIEVEGFTPENDDIWKRGEIAQAASCYSSLNLFRSERSDGAPFYWPYRYKWWKPTPDDRIRELVKAGALIVAEIERLQRLDSKP